MKKLLLILLCLPMIGFGQFNLKTYVPDNMFEYYLEGSGLGDGVPLNDSVWTSAIDTVTYVDIPFLGTPIGNLTGIEDFMNLFHLEVKHNNIDSIDLSHNSQLFYVHLRDDNLINVNIGYLPNLQYLLIDENQISEIDLTGAPNLRLFACQFNQLTSLDVFNNIYLFSVYCWDNQITSLDLSNNIWLDYLNCENNALSELDIRNGHNNQMIEFNSWGNPNLYCINVDDSTWATNNWTIANGNIEPQYYFSNNCSGTTDIQEHTINKKLLRTINVIGRETKQTNQPLFYIYDDGTVEKRIIIE